MAPATTSEAENFANWNELEFASAIQAILKQLKAIGQAFSAAVDLAFKPLNIRSGVNGISRNRTPVASKTAFAIAAGTTIIGVSAAPAAGISGRFNKWI